MPKKPPPKRGISFDMQDRTGCEPPVRELAIILAVDSIEDEKLGAVLMRLGNLIEDYCEALEERRGELFKLLHPNRKHFEKEGWPGEEQP
jgi:hypothetical protein